MMIMRLMQIKLITITIMKSINNNDIDQDDDVPLWNYDDNDTWATKP